MGVAVSHRLHPARLGRCYDSFYEVHAGNDFYDCLCCSTTLNSTSMAGPPYRREQHHDQRASPGGQYQASGEAKMSTISRSRTTLQASPVTTFSAASRARL